jgi:hypothetical protein
MALLSELYWSKVEHYIGNMVLFRIHPQEMRDGWKRFKEGYKNPLSPTA